MRANLNWSGRYARQSIPIDDRRDLLAQPRSTWPRRSQLRSAVAVHARRRGSGGRCSCEPSSIVEGTGAIAPQDARLSQRYARVIEQRSDLRAVNRQLSIGLQPLAFNTRYSWSLTYVYSNTRDKASRRDEHGRRIRAQAAWARSSLDSRHQVVYGLSYNFFDWLPVSLTGSFRSGRPFTPVVAGDVNGDGFANDRAFVFDPSASSTDAGLVAGMQSLLSSGSRAARDCLTSQVGKLAARNSCEGPWTTTSNLTIGLNPQKLRLPQRVNLAFYVNNAFGAADLLLHGEKNRRGWGQAFTPDQSLLFVRGFDAARKAFRYDVNPRFGATSLRQTVNRNPVVLTAQVRVDVGFARERQLLTQSLDRGRARAGAKPNDQAIRGMSTTLIPPNPMALILAQGDSLGSRASRPTVSRRSTSSTPARLDSIWTPVATYLAALPLTYDREAAYQRYREAREASVDVLIRLAPTFAAC